MKPSNAPAATDEQLAAVEMFGHGRNLQINAFAGTGKTSTLELISRSTRKAGHYLAFNRSMAVEAQARFPSHVTCTTGHAAAYREVREFFAGDERKLAGNVSAALIAQALDLKPFGSGSSSIPPRSLAFLVQKTLGRFLHSADAELSSAHFVAAGVLGSAEFRHRDEVAATVVRHARKLWARMRDPRDAVPLGHDGYLKHWALSNPRIKAEFLMLDEAQDSNPVILDVVRRQPCQIVYVGDKHQQIYEWRGAVNAMDGLSGATVCYLTLSFRFGEAIAGAANRVLSRLGEKKRITGNPSVRSRLAEVEPEAILSRSNARIIAEVMSALQTDRKPAILGGPSELLRMLEGVSDLKAARATPVEEFLGFSNWHEVEDFARSAEGSHLLPFVGTVEKWGEKALVNALGRVVDDTACDVVLSTVHKAKGREWSKVRVVGDFGVKADELFGESGAGGRKSAKAENLRLLYVAMTRAKSGLHMALDEGTGGLATPAAPYAERSFTDHDRVATGPISTFVAEKGAGGSAPDRARRGASGKSGEGGLTGFWKSFLKK